MLGILEDSEGSYNQLEGILCGKEEKKTWNSVPLGIFWSIWKERNRLALEMGL